MDAAILFSEDARNSESPMTSALFFEGSNSPPLGFDIETYSPQEFPHTMKDPIVNFSLALHILGDFKKGVLIVSLICQPSLGERLLRLLHNLLCTFRGNHLLTDNGSKFDVEYVIERGRIFGLDFKMLFSDYLHNDLYKTVRQLNFKLSNYSQKNVEHMISFRRVVNDVSGSSYHLSFAEFLNDANLKAAFYNIEDSVGCLRILDRLTFLSLIS